MVPSVSYRKITLVSTGAVGFSRMLTGLNIGARGYKWWLLRTSSGASGYRRGVLAFLVTHQLLADVSVQPLIQSYATRSVPFATVIEPHSRNPKDRNARRIGALFSWVSQRK